MSPYSGRALSGKGQICRDREQASLNPVASHGVVESIIIIIIGQLYQCFHMVETPFVGSCVASSLSSYRASILTSENLLLLRSIFFFVETHRGQDHERRYGCHMYVLTAMDSSI